MRNQAWGLKLLSSLLIFSTALNSFTPGYASDGHTNPDDLPNSSLTGGLLPPSDRAPITLSGEGFGTVESDGSVTPSSFSGVQQTLPTEDAVAYARAWARTFADGAAKDPNSENRVIFRIVEEGASDLADRDAAIDAAVMDGASSNPAITVERIVIPKEAAQEIRQSAIGKWAASIKKHAVNHPAGYETTFAAARVLPAALTFVGVYADDQVVLPALAAAFAIGYSSRWLQKNKTKYFNLIMGYTKSKLLRINALFRPFARPVVNQVLKTAGIPMDDKSLDVLIRSVAGLPIWWLVEYAFYAIKAVARNVGRMATGMTVPLVEWGRQFRGVHNTATWTTFGQAPGEYGIIFRELAIKREFVVRLQEMGFSEEQISKISYDHLDMSTPGLPDDFKEYFIKERVKMSFFLLLNSWGSVGPGMLLDSESFRAAGLMGITMLFGVGFTASIQQFLFLKRRMQQLAGELKDKACQASFKSSPSTPRQSAGAHP